VVISASYGWMVEGFGVAGEIDTRSTLWLHRWPVEQGRRRVRGADAR
jgi:hypothetical protein